MAIASRALMPALRLGGWQSDQLRRRPLWRLGQSSSGRLGGSIVLTLIATALAAPVLAPGGYATPDLAHMLQAPAWMAGGSAEHLLGTDSLGRAVASRIVWAGRVSLAVAAVSVVVAMTVGVTAGLFAGYYGGFIDALIMRLADVQLAFPYLLLAITVMAVLGPSLPNLILLLALPGWMVYARTVRSSILSLRESDFVLAAVSTGLTHRRIIFRHLLPNIVAPVIVISSFQVALVIISEASLSFLGVGVQPPMPSWGSMLSEGREYFTTAWWLAVFPGLAITLAVLGANLLGDGLREAFDPRLKP